MKENISEKAQNAILAILTDLCTTKELNTMHVLEAQKRIINRVEADVFGNSLTIPFASIKETVDNSLANKNNLV